MTTVTRYQSENGRTYEKPEDAAEQDALFRRQNEVSKLLPQAIDESCTFSNGGGYVQQTKEDVKAFTDGILGLIEMEFGKDSGAAKAFRAYPGAGSLVGRYLDDSDSNTYRLWCRLASMDLSLREWGQGYYALHPSEGVEKPWPNVTRAGLKFYD